MNNMHKYGFLLASLLLCCSPQTKSPLMVGARAFTKHCHRDHSSSWWGVSAGSEFHLSACMPIYVSLFYLSLSVIFHSYIIWRERETDRQTHTHVLLRYPLSSLHITSNLSVSVMLLL